MIFELYRYEYDEDGGIVKIATEDSYAGAHNMNCEQRCCDSDSARDNMLLMGYHYAKRAFEEWLDDPLFVDENGNALVNFENIREFTEAFQDSLVEEYAFADNGVCDEHNIPLTDEMLDDIEDELKYIGCDLGQDLFVSGITTYFNNHAIEIENTIYELLGGTTYKYIDSSYLRCIQKDYAPSPYGYNEHDNSILDEELDDNFKKYKSLPDIICPDFIPTERFNPLIQTCTTAYDYLVILSILDVINESYGGEWIYLDEIMAMFVADIYDILTNYSILQYESYSSFRQIKYGIPNYLTDEENIDKSSLYHTLVFNDYDCFNDELRDIIQKTVIHLLSAWFEVDEDKELIYLSNKYPSIPLYTYHRSKLFQDSCIVINLSDLDYIKTNYQSIREWIMWNMKTVQ